MKKRLIGSLALVVGSLLAASCTKRIDLKMAVDVLSQPEKAEVRYHGKAIGETPKSLRIATYDDLDAIVATKPDLDVVEKRIRILSSDKAQLFFRFGKGEVSPVARKLGLTRVLVFEYSEKVSFDSNKADLKPEGLSILDRQAEILNQHFPNATVYVCGYTDSTGSEELNDRLSLQRAEAVRNYLASKKVDPARMRTEGFGKQFEIASNATPEGRAQNRRTEVILPQ